MLTADEDHINGSSGADVFMAPTVNGLLGIQTDTLQSVDVINGGAGNDTLMATIASPVSLLLGPAAPVLTSVETVDVRFAGLSFGVTGIDLANATGVQELNVANSSSEGEIRNVGNVAKLGVANQTQDVTFWGETATALTLGVSDVGNATTTTDVYVNDTGLSSVNLSITDSNLELSTDAGGAGVTSLAIKASGDNTLNLAGANSQLVNVTVTGAGNLLLDPATALNGPLKTFDGSAATGNIEVTVSSSAKVAVATGAGKDKIYMDAVAGVVAGSTVASGAGDDLVSVGDNLDLFASAAGGDGTDIINVTDGGDITATTAPKVTGFEVLDISGGTGTYDLSQIAFTKVQIDAGINGALTGPVILDKVADTSQLNVMSAGGNDLLLAPITVQLATPAGTDSTTIDVAINDGNKDNVANGNVTFSSYTAAGVESVTINSTVVTTDGGLTAVKDSAYKTTFTALDLDAVKTLTLGGTSSIEITALTNGATNSLTKVDAAASKGNIKLDVSALTTQVAYSGAAGKDTYAATDGGSIYGAAGNDAFTLTAAGANQDTVIYKAASDSTLAVTAGKVDLSTAESIAGFSTVASGNTPDTLDFSTFGFSGFAAGAAVSKGAVVAVGFSASIADFFADAGGDRGVAFGTEGTDTYVFVDANKDGNWTATDDLAIKLTGVTDFAVTSVTF